MIEPVAVGEIAIAAMLAGAIVFFGAAYALFYALGMQNARRRFLPLAHTSYLALLVSTAGLATVLNLSGRWLIIVAALLAGYFAAPRFIWHLSIATHEVGEDHESETHSVRRGMPP